MKQWDHKMVVILPVIFMVFFASFCWPGRREHRLTIAVHASVEGEALKRVANRFANQQNIPIEVIELPYDDLYQREQDQLAHLSPPEESASRFDVMMVDDPWLPALLLNPYQQSEGPRQSIQAQGSENLVFAGPQQTRQYRLQRLQMTPQQEKDLEEDFFPSSLEVSRDPYCGNTKLCDYYGLPFVGNSQLFCYPHRFFPDKPPDDWEQVAAAFRRTEPDGKRRRYVARIGPGNPIATDFLPILWSYDSESFPTTLTNDPHLLRHPEKANAAFNRLVELVGKRDAGTASLDDFDVSAYLAKEPNSMGILWSAWAMMLSNAAEDGETRDFMCSEVPGKTPELGTWLLAIPSDSELSEQAKDFVFYATSKEQIRLAAFDGNPPPRRSVLQDDQIPQKHSRFFAAQLKSLERARPRPRTAYWREMEKLLSDQLEKVVWGNSQGQQVQKVVSGLNDAFQPLLKKESQLRDHFSKSGFTRIAHK